MNIHPFSVHGFYVVVLQDIDDDNEKGFQLVTSCEDLGWMVKPSPIDIFEDEVNAVPVKPSQNFGLHHCIRAGNMVDVHLHRRLQPPSVISSVSSTFSPSSSCWPSSSSSWMTSHLK